jgi:glycosyltransferase involved in cell wall biosynthesis
MIGTRVCHLGKYYPPSAGGIETHVRTLARAQADLGACVQVFCVNHEAGPTVAERDGPVDVTRFGRLISAAKLDICPDLVVALRRVEADILHLQVPNPTMILALLAARLRIPLVVSYQSDVVRQRVLKVLFRPLERLQYRRARVIMPSSPLYPGGSPFLRSYNDRIQVLPLGIDLQPYLHPSPDDRQRAAGIRARYAPGEPLWLCAGRHVYYKGLINAVRALTRVRGRLLLIGAGPDQPALRAEARQLGVADRVVFLGTLSQRLSGNFFLCFLVFEGDRPLGLIRL